MLGEARMSIAKFICFLAALTFVSSAVALRSVEEVRPADAMANTCPPFLVIGFGCMPSIADVYIQ
jgi:hypothetical protein